MSVMLKGADVVSAKLARMASRLPGVVSAAMYAEAEIEMAEAKRRTPWDTGALRSSGHVQPPRRDGSGVSVTLGFGGSAAPYAIFVHENLEAFHPNGQAKFLESTLTESSPYMADRIAKRIDLNALAR